MTSIPSNDNTAGLPDSSQETEEVGQEVEVPAQSSEQPTTPPGQGTKINNAHDTPYKYSTSSHLLYTSMHYLRDLRYCQAEMENRGKFVSISPEEFFKRFLSADSSNTFELNATAQGKLMQAAECRKETDSYPFFKEALSTYCPSFEIINSSNHPKMVTWGRQEVEIKPDLSTNLKNGNAVSGDRGVDIDKVEVMLEAKWVNSDDAFDDSHRKSFERDSRRGGDTRGQITAYATAQLAHQHRTHCFSVLLVKGGARILRWDRGGAYVTKKFDYVEEPWLAKFFHWYNSASLSDRGIDTSVERLSAEDSLGREAREKLDIQSGQPLYKFNIVDDATGGITNYIGSEPTFTSGGSFTGRCTRCYRVYDVQTKKVAFMKDTWRVDGKDATKEGEVYKLLKEHDVPNILTLVTYGDVRPQGNSAARQTTQTHLLKHPRAHCHARLVFEEIGQDLTHFKTTGEMVSAISDAIKAHQAAYEKAKILHRDVSVGNILILPNGKGVLIDWDLSKLLDKKGTPRQTQRTGTWQFMSARLLADLDAPVHELVDDLESFYHVLTWVALRFTPHSILKFDLVDLLHTWFDEALFGGGEVPVGGKRKAMYLKIRYMGGQSQLPTGTLRDLIVDLEAVLRIRYAEQPTEAHIEQLNLLEERYSQGNIDERRYKSLKSNIEEHTDNLTWQRTEYTERLTSHTWIVSRFQKAASLKSDMSDKRVVHDVTLSKEDEVEKRVPKRSSELEEDPEDLRPTQRRRLD